MAKYNAPIMPNLSNEAKERLFLIPIFVAMILGMVAKTTFDSLTMAVPFEWRKFLIPLLVSPIVYGSVLQFTQNSSTDRILMLIFGFQNGFFWQDVLG